MLILFDTDGRGPRPAQLLCRGCGFVVVVAFVVAALLARSTGVLDARIEVTALLSEIGDGLPEKSDVKFRGLLVGAVVGVTPGDRERPHRVRIALDPQFRAGIPRTVTARVVPSNVFAVSSVQLVDNGAAPPLPENAEIPQDRSRATVQLQTALTKMRDIVAATTRVGTDRTVGILATIAAATDRRGDKIERAGEQLEDIVAELGPLLRPDGGPSTLGALSDAVRGLTTAAPELLDALHRTVVPMRTLVEQQAELADLLTAGDNTFSTVGTALENNTGRIVDITTKLEPVLGVLADGSAEFGPVTVRLRRLSELWFAEFWDPEALTGTGKLQLRFTPHTPYTRADCPRYGDMAGPSCATAPEAVAPQPLPPWMDPRSVPVPPLPPELLEMIGRIVGGDANAAETLVGGLLTGTPAAGGPR